MILLPQEAKNYKNEGVKLSSEAAHALGELLWYVHLDIGAYAQNVYLSPEGHAVIIDCEDKGEEWVTNIQKVWTNFDASPEAIAMRTLIKAAIKAYISTVVTPVDYAPRR